MKSIFLFGFKTWTPEKLIMYYDYVTTQLLDNKTFPTLQAMAASVKSNGVSYQSLFKTAQKGGVDDKKARDVQRKTLEAALKQLTFAAEIACGGDKTLGSQTGLTMAQTTIDRTRKAKFAAAVLKFLSKEGLSPNSSDLSWQHAENGYMYIIKLSFGDENVWTEGELTGETFITLENLDPNVRTFAKICAVTKQGKRGVWSEPIRLRIY